MPGSSTSRRQPPGLTCRLNVPTTRPSSLTAFLPNFLFSLDPPSLRAPAGYLSAGCVTRIMIVGSSWSCLVKIPMTSDDCRCFKFKLTCCRRRPRLDPTHPSLTVRRSRSRGSVRVGRAEMPWQPGRTCTPARAQACRHRPVAISGLGVLAAQSAAGPS